MHAPGSRKESKLTHQERNLPILPDSCGAKSGYLPAENLTEAHKRALKVPPPAAPQDENQPASRTPRVFCGTPPGSAHPSAARLSSQGSVVKAYDAPAARASSLRRCRRASSDSPAGARGDKAAAEGSPHRSPPRAALLPASALSDDPLFSPPKRLKPSPGKLAFLVEARSPPARSPAWVPGPGAEDCRALDMPGVPEQWGAGEAVAVPGAGRQRGRGCKRRASAPEAPAGDALAPCLATDRPPLPPSKAGPSRAALSDRSPSPHRQLARRLSVPVLEKGPRKGGSGVEVHATMQAAARGPSSSGWEAGPVGERYELGRTIGSGAFSIVREARCRRGGLEGRRVAVKTITVVSAAWRTRKAKCQPGTCRTLEEVREEVAAMRAAQGEGAGAGAVVGLVSAHLEPGRAHLALELCEGGTLQGALRRAGRLEEGGAARAVARVAAGLAALHRGGRLHRDVKPENVLLRRAGDFDSAALGDFGLATSVEAASGAKEDHPGCGTPAFLAPETLCLTTREPEALALYSPASDMWSLGCTLLLLLTGRHITPWLGAPPHIKSAVQEMRHRRAVEALQEWVQGELSGVYSRLPPSCTPSAAAQALIQRLLQVAPAARPSAAGLLDSEPWLRHAAAGTLQGGAALRRATSLPAPKRPAEAEGRGASEAARAEERRGGSAAGGRRVHRRGSVDEAALQEAAARAAEAPAGARRASLPGAAGEPGEALGGGAEAGPDTTRRRLSAAMSRARGFMQAFFNGNATM